MLDSGFKQISDESAIANSARTIHEQSTPSRISGFLEYATLVWVDWFNNRRLLEPLGYVPPAEFEEAYYRGPQSQARRPDSSKSASGEPGPIHSD